MLAEFLRQRGYPVVCLNGSMDLEERKTVQRAFANDAQVLISTDAGGEGLNLQFCHVIVNYDLPWNPMKLEQRIGRVDRIGQKHVVRALNFALKDTVELRVREVLEEKLQRILEEFGVDKLSDVLDSEEGGVDFEQLYLHWPDGTENLGVCFARAEAADLGAPLLSLEDPRVRGLTTRLPPHAPGGSVPAVWIPGISDKVSGVWSLWRVALQTAKGRLQRMLPLFLRHDGRVLGPTARAVWDRLIEQRAGVTGRPEGLVSGAAAVAIFEQHRKAAEEHGRVVFAELQQEQQQHLDRERRRLTVAIEARRRAVDRLGLPEVRAFRRAQVEREERLWRVQLAKNETGLPELTPLLMVAVAGEGP
jgi:hypothetical protein